MPTTAEFLSSPRNAGVWTLVHDRSRFAFTNKTMWGLLNVKGRFTAFRGEGRIAETGAVTGRIDIKAESVHTGIRKRDDHLRSADFFDAQHHPDITVTVNAATATAADQVDIGADLGIRGNTLALPMRARVRILDDGCVSISARTTVHREQLGVSGDMAGMVGATTNISAEAVFRRAGS